MYRPRCGITTWGPLLGVVSLGLVPPSSGQDAARTGRAFDVSHYDLTVEPDIGGKTIQGRVNIQLVVTTDSLSAIDLDIGSLTIDVVKEGEAPVEFTQADRRLRVLLGSKAVGGQILRLSVDYHGAPRYGLEFVPDKAQVYTLFSTSQWMPCVDAPSDKATLGISLILPEDLVVVANGEKVSSKKLEGNRVSHVWRLDQEAPSYTFGFAAGRFNELTEKRGGTVLRYLSAAASGDELRRIFADTRNMLAFFEERSGVRYKSSSYTQALVHKTIGQELAGFSLMSEEYGRSVLSDPQAVGLIAHEFAHQWWGNGVTCAEWTHFWLNEGFATFMAAAYRESRFGREAYLKDVEAWRARYERIRAVAKDRSLVFPDWNKPTSDDRALVYQKGALVLHELRVRVGDRAFWKGLRDYTRKNAGRSVVTADFQRVMERSVGRDLSGFFNEWVYASAVHQP